MKLDPKYFTLFITVCAAVTAFVIFFGTVRYNQNQESRLRDNVANLDLDSVRLASVSHADSIRLSDFRGEAVLIGFWSTWSGKSRNVHRALDRIRKDQPGLTVLAAAVRDSDEMVEEYVEQHAYDFIYVDGTDFYHELQIPGIPSHILIDRDGRFFDLQIGEGMKTLEVKIESLMKIHGTL